MIQTLKNEGHLGRRTVTCGDWSKLSAQIWDELLMKVTNRICAPLGLSAFDSPICHHIHHLLFVLPPYALKKKNKQTVNACLHHGQRLLANFGEAQLVQQNQPGSTGISTNLI